MTDQNLTFSQALDLLKAGHSIARNAWQICDGCFHIYKAESEKYKDKIMRRVPVGRGGRMWAITAEDILAEDWYQVDV